LQRPASEFHETPISPAEADFLPPTTLGSAVAVGSATRRSLQACNSVIGITRTTGRRPSLGLRFTVHLPVFLFSSDNVITIAHNPPNAGNL
jgi:hypothetical protein